MIRPEYPDPLLSRRDWLSLNGEWEFAADPAGQGVAEKWQQKAALPERIVVPFCVESKASGQGRKTRALHFWYRRTVRIPDEWRGRQIHLRIGAADYQCTGYVNGIKVGEHAGGFTPMAWRVDPFLRDGDNSFCLHVQETRDGRLPRGKQTHLPVEYTVFYQTFSGIWQPVWLETRGPMHLISAHAVPDVSAKSFVFHLRIHEPVGGEVGIKLIHPDGEVDTEVHAEIDGERMAVPVHPRRVARWSPDEPNLYTVRYTIRQNEQVVDEAEGYAGLRSFRVADGKVLLNGQPFYQKLVLYQAYYPEGWVTAVDDETYRRDVELIKACGFNGLRLHQTLADPRLLYWCDRLGLVVWDEMPSAFVFSLVDRAAFEALLREAIDRDLGHPAVMLWLLFNETWGIFDLLWSEKTRDWLREMIALTRRLDPSRPVIDNSGYEHLATDILDVHHYLAGAERIRDFYRRLADPAQLPYRHWRNLYVALPRRVYKSPLLDPSSYQGQPVVISECGGHGFKHYGDRSLSLADGLRQTFDLLAEHEHLQGFAYTQFCDVAQEENGLFTFDRRPKIEPAEVRRLLESAFGHR